MLINDKYQYAPCVKKVWREEEKKRNATPRHKEFMVWEFKAKKSMERCAKSIVKVFPKKDISHLEKGEKSSFIENKFFESKYFVRLEFYTQNPYPLLFKIELKGMYLGYGMSNMYEPPKDKTNYMVLYKKTTKEIKLQLSKLNDKELKNFGKNLKLRDILIKRVKRKSTYHVSTIDSWIMDEVEKALIMQKITGDKK